MSSIIKMVERAKHHQKNGDKVGETSEKRTPVIKSFPFMFNLSQEVLKFYSENGYVIIKGLLDATTIQNSIQRFMDICDRKVPRDLVAVIESKDLVDKNKKRYEYVNKINNLSHDPVFMTATEHPRLLHILTQLIGDELWVMNSMLINKPPGSVWHPPHQDMFHIPIKPWDNVVTTWTALEPVTRDNGCLFVVPGSHRDNKLYEQVQIKNYATNKLYYTIPEPEKVAPEDKLISLAPLEPGDTVIINSLLVHGSWPNKSQHFRKAITSVYAGRHYYVDVKGTVQEVFENDVLEEIKNAGIEGVTFQDFWKFRSKLIQNYKSSL